MVRTYGNFLQSPDDVAKLSEVHKKVLNLHSKNIEQLRQSALDGSKLRWEVCDKKLEDKNIYCSLNFIRALSRIHVYVNCIRQFGTNWIGLKFRFPLIWIPTLKYQHYFQLKLREAETRELDLIGFEGYTIINENTTNLIILLTCNHNMC